MAKAQKNAAPNKTAPSQPAGAGERKRMVKRLNTRFLLISLGLFAALLPAVYLVHAWQIDGNADKLKDRAEAAESEGDYVKALQLYGQYLNFRENDFETLLHYQRLRDGMATTGERLSRVMLGYEELLIRDPNRADEAEIRQDIVALAMTLGEHHLALHHLKTLLEEERFQSLLDKDPQKLAELRFQSAQCLDAKGEIQPAFSKYLDVLKSQPGDYRYYLPVAALFGNQSRNLPPRPEPSEDQAAVVPVTLPDRIRALLPEKNEIDFRGNEAADQILEWMIDNSESPAEAYLARAGYRNQRGRFDEARQDVETARASGGDSLDLLLFSAGLGVEQAHNARLRGPWAKYSPAVRLARQDAARGREQYPSDPRFSLLQSVIEEEARDGLTLLPARAQKPGETEQIADTREGRLRNARLEAQQKIAKALREGINIAEERFQELKNQEPVRTSLRIREKNPQLTQLRLNQIAMQLRWSLADNLITAHQLLTGEARQKNSKPASAESLKSEVNQLADSLKRAGASTGMIDFLNARLLIVEEDWKEASWKLEQTRLRLSGQTAMIRRIDSLLDECYGQMGNPDKQLQVAQRAIREKSNWLEALVRLPLLYQEANRIDEALRAYEAIKNLPGAAQGMAQLRLRRELNQPVGNRRWDAIHKLLDSAEANPADDPATVKILRAEVLSLEAAQLAEQQDEAKSEKKFREAAAELDKALISLPENPRLWAARGLMELQTPFPKDRTIEERIQDAAEIVETAILKNGDSLPLRLAAVRIASLLPTEDAVREISALETPAFPPKEQPEFLASLAQAHLIVARRTTDQKDKDAALNRVLEYHKQAAALQSQQVAPQIRLAEWAVELKSPATIQTAIDRVEAVEGPNGPNGNYLKALQLIVGLKEGDKDNVERARQLLKQAMKERPFWVALPRLLGELEWQVQNKEAAVSHYVKAFELGERSRTMISRVVDHYYGSQQLDRADEFLRRVALDTPVLLSGDLARQKWQVDFRMQRYEEAVDVATEVAAHSTSFDDHIWESRLRFARGDRGATVLKPLLKAVELAKDQPKPWLALVSYYARVGKMAEANAAIEDAKKNLAPEPPHQRLFALAQCYDIISDRNQAEQHYRAALNAGKDESREVKAGLKIALADFYTRSRETDPEQQKLSFNKAGEVLDELLDPGADVPESARDWARLRKSLMTASTGRYDDTERALALLTKGRSGEKASDEDLRTEVKILRSRNRYQDRLAIIKILESLDDRKVLSLDERFLLAHAYESTNQWPEAQAQFKKLMDLVTISQKSARAKLLADYALALLNRKDLDEAKMLAEGQSLVQELETLEPKSFRAVTARALLLYRQKQGPDAATILKTYIASLDLQTPEQALRDLIEQQEIDKALDSLQKALDKESAQKITDHVRKLLAEGDHDEAIAVLKRYIQASDLVANVQTTLVRVIARFLEELEQYAAAEETFREYARRSKQPEAILEVAGFLARQNRVDEALTICESAWEKCDPRIVAKVSVGTLRTAGKPTAAELQRVETHLTNAIENAKTEHWTDLVTSFADLRDLQGRHAESINIYREMLKRNPNNVTALNNLAWLLSYQSPDMAEAQQLIDQAIRQYGPVGALVDTRGMIYLRRGQPAKALRDIKQAAEELPVAGIYFHLAQAHLAAGDKKAAEAAFRDAEAKNLDPVTDLHVLESGDYERMKEMFK